MLQAWIIVLLLFSKSLLALDLEWKPDQCGDPEGFKVKQGTVHGHAYLNQSRELDQGTSNTCYVHTVKQILEHHHNPNIDLTIESILEGGCAADPSSDSAGFSLLYRLRKQ